MSRIPRPGKVTFVHDRNYPKISIVTPSYNQGEFLERTILSVLDQGYPNLEYIIIDGQSSDQSVEIIKKYEKHLAYWVSEEDRGQSHAINKGFGHASGELFGWLNSDDWYSSGALQAVAEAARLNPSASVIVGAGDMVDEEGNLVRYVKPDAITRESLYGWLHSYFWQPSCFFSKDAWIQCGPLDEELQYAMDLDLWLKIAKRFPFLTIDRNLSTSLKHPRAKTTASNYLSVMEAALVIASHGGNKTVSADLKRYADYLDEKERAYTLRLAHMEQSASWRITAPLRFLRAKMAGLLQ